MKMDAQTALSHILALMHEYPADAKRMNVMTETKELGWFRHVPKKTMTQGDLNLRRVWVPLEEVREDVKMLLPYIKDEEEQWLETVKYLNLLDLLEA